MSLRIGSIGYATDQGLGMLHKQFYESGLITHPAIYRHPHPSRPTHTEWFKDPLVLNSRPFQIQPGLAEWANSVDVVLFFETAFDWSVISYLRDRGIKTALMPMYEWAPTSFGAHKPDLFICPSLLDVQYFPGNPFMPVPVDPSRWRLRTRARHFVHNAGHLGCRGHKGTLEILQAMRYVKSPLKLTVRAQDTAELREKVGQSGGCVDDRVHIEYGQIPYENLFDEGDVFIMAEKFNGLSLPLQEARAAGMAVMTSNRFPMNTWLPEEYLIPVASYHEARVSAGHSLFQEAVVEPQAIAAKMDEVFGTDLTEVSSSGKEWASRNSWEAVKPQYVSQLENLCNA